MERVSVEEFRTSGLGVVRPVADTERVPLAEAVGRVAAEDVVASVPLPSFRRSAVDGYALRAADAAQALRVVGKITAGHPAPRALKPGEAYAITTGAPVPDGADAVTLVEETEQTGDWVRTRERVEPGLHVSPVGEDFRLGQPLVRRDRVLTSVDVAALASQGRETVAVWRRPRVAIVSTGDELRPLGTTLGPGEVYDVNGAALEAMVRAAGCEPIRLGTWPDRYEVVREGMAAAAARTDWDVMVTSGGTGASVPLFQGVDVKTLHDLVPAVLAEVGRLIHHGVRMIPGRPTALGLLDDRPVFALPGWPYAVLIHFEIMVLPALRRMAHLPPARRPALPARLAAPVSGTEGFTRIIQVRLDQESAGGLTAEPLLPPPPPSASRVMTQMLEADGYIVLEGPVRWEKGQPVTVWVDPARMREGWIQ
ncbi:MAG: molybdopterin molybdotransferase MoeA [Actinomycetia bacterium]|nr:molybdopterin molybdotransferase MoeA [Actinomycetes bacterium]